MEQTEGDIRVIHALPESPRGCSAAADGTGFSPWMQTAPGLTAAFHRSFPGGAEIRVDQLCLDAASGVTVLCGASGAGKTTILRCLAGLEVPDAGRIQCGAEVWFDSRQRRWLAPQHRRVGFVPQDYLLFPHLTAAENIGYSLRSLSAAERRSRVHEALAWLGLERLGARRPGELSGGEQQRVALARAVVRSPQLLLLDEPLSAVDGPSRQRLRRELRQWLVHTGLPTLLVTHDTAEAIALGDRLAVLEGGRLGQVGAVGDVISRPATPAIARLLGVETVVKGWVVSRWDDGVVVSVAGTPLQALAAGLPAGATEVHVCIRAEDVVLTQDRGSASSVRNRLPAMVVGVQAGRPLARIDLDCGFPLKALVTPGALEELDLRPGVRLDAWIKAPHVRLIAV